MGRREGWVTVEGEEPHVRGMQHFVASMLASLAFVRFAVARSLMHAWEHIS